MKKETIWVGTGYFYGVEAGCVLRALLLPPGKWQLPGEQRHPRDGDSRDKPRQGEQGGTDPKGRERDPAPLQGAQLLPWP